MVNFKGDLKEFFTNNNISHLALGVIMGNAGAIVIKSFMENIIVPVISSIEDVSPKQWKNKHIGVFGIQLKLRLFLSDFFTFVLTILVAFVFIQYITKPLLSVAKSK